MSGSISEIGYRKLCLAEEKFLSAVDEAHYLLSQPELVTLLDTIGGLIREAKDGVEIQMPEGHVRPHSDLKVADVGGWPEPAERYSLL